MYTLAFTNDKVTTTILCQLPRLGCERIPHAAARHCSKSKEDAVGCLEASKERAVAYFSERAFSSTLP